MNDKDFNIRFLKEHHWQFDNLIQAWLRMYTSKVLDNFKHSYKPLCLLNQCLMQLFLRSIRFMYGHIDIYKR